MGSHRMIAGRYRLHTAIGAGGMGEVWQATDSVLGREVAVKVMNARGDSRLAERFRREAIATAAISHPRVVRIYDAGVETADGETIAYMVMELLPGPSVAQILAAERPLTTARSLGLMSEIVEAVRHVHDRGLVHRDIKPDNLLLDAEGRVTLIDLGIARVMSVHEERITVTNEVIGSLKYLAPEQAKGADVATGTDVYALGCVFYQLLTGTPPFTADSAAGLIYQHTSVAAPKLAASPDLPESVAKIVARMLSKKVSDRPPLDEVNAALRAAGQTVSSAKPTGPRWFPVRWSRRARTAVAATAVLVVLAGAGAWRMTSRDEHDLPDASCLDAQSGPHQLMKAILADATVHVTVSESEMQGFVERYKRYSGQMDGAWKAGNDRRWLDACWRLIGLFDDIADQAGLSNARSRDGYLEFQWPNGSRGPDDQ